MSETSPDATATTSPDVTAVTATTSPDVTASSATMPSPDAIGRTISADTPATASLSATETASPGLGTTTERGARSARMPAGPEVDEATRVFAGHRELLFSIVSNMLGIVADTEDVLQETWLVWAPRSRDENAEEIEHPRAYLVRIA